jgi:hypothetical protein
MKKKFYTAIAIIAFIGLSNASFAQTHQRGGDVNQRGNDQTARVENNQFNGRGDDNNHYVNGSRQEDRHFNNEDNRRDDRRHDYDNRSEHGRFNHEENRCDRRF